MLLKGVDENLVVVCGEGGCFLFGLLLGRLPLRYEFVLGGGRCCHLLPVGSLLGLQLELLLLLQLDRLL